MSHLSFLLGLLMLSFFIHSALFVPYINFLYRVKFQRQKQRTKDAFGKLTPIFDRFHKNKAGVPVGGGLLIVAVTLMLYGITFLALYYLREWYVITSLYPKIIEEVKIIVFTFISFAVIGFYDDFRKTFVPKGDDFFGLRLRHKLILETIIAGIVAYWLYTLLDISFIHIPLVNWKLAIGFWYVPFAMFVILAFANAFNITDGLDGLAGGLLVIALMSFWVISAGLLDTPLAVFIPILLGGLIAFLYFNVYPARIILGDVGALSFGATFAVIGLMLGKPLALVIVGGIFVLEAGTSLTQLLWKRFKKRKLMPCAPFHLYLQYIGWEEPKIVLRMWLAGIMLAVFGLWLSFLQ